MLTESDRCSRSHVLVTMIVQDLLELVRFDPGLIHEHVVMCGTRGSLERLVRAEIDVVLVGMSHVAVDNGPGEGILVVIARPTREEADVVSLLGHHDSEFHLA